jgi:hypothetical protein
MPVVVSQRTFPVSDGRIARLAVSTGGRRSLVAIRAIEASDRPVSRMLRASRKTYGLIAGNMT